MSALVPLGLIVFLSLLRLSSGRTKGVMGQRGLWLDYYSTHLGHLGSQRFGKRKQTENQGAQDANKECSSEGKCCSNLSEHHYQEFETGLENYVGGGET